MSDATPDESALENELDDTERLIDGDLVDGLIDDEPVELPAPILPPATLGVLGGGQLGRYFVIAARTMGYRTMVLEPDPHAPAGAVADVHLVADYDDPSALEQLAVNCAVVTTEFENPPASALHHLAQLTIVRPSPAAIEIAQDRVREKRFLQSVGVPVAPFLVIDSAVAVAEATHLGYPAILKTSRLGYDGKGQVAVASHADLPEAWDRLGRVVCVLERRLPLDREVSVVLARSVDGSVAAHPAGVNVHVGGILDITTVPADPHVVARATELAVQIAQELQYVGVLGVELFEVDGAMLVNELAPRPHNSGHWTLDAAATSQFEQQVRAVCGLQLGDPSLTSTSAAMVNLLGDLWDQGPPDWASAVGVPGAHLHLYGKTEPRRGRKMGHLTVRGDGTPDAAAAVALACRSDARLGLQLDL
jgi:5-(carboxyamino)imidazole ribonucleotide synthase